MSGCSHNHFRFVPDGLPFPSGREVCDQCGAYRVIDGDHTGRWMAPDDPSASGATGSSGTADVSGKASDEPAGDAHTSQARGGSAVGGAVVAGDELTLLAEAFGLDDAATAGLLRVEPAELERWRQSGVPEQRSAEVEALAALAARLLATYHPEMVPRVMQAPVPGGTGWSALDAIRAGHHEAVIQLMAPVGDYVMDADPGGVRQQRSDAARVALDRAMDGAE